MLHRCFRCFDNIYDHQLSSYCCYPALLPKYRYFLTYFLKFETGFFKGFQLVNDVGVLNDVLGTFQSFVMSFYGILGHFVGHLRHIF